MRALSQEDRETSNQGEASGGHLEGVGGALAGWSRLRCGGSTGLRRASGSRGEGGHGRGAVATSGWVWRSRVGDHNGGGAGNWDCEVSVILHDLGRMEFVGREVSEQPRRPNYQDLDSLTDGRGGGVGDSNRRSLDRSWSDDRHDGDGGAGLWDWSVGGWGGGLDGRRLNSRGGGSDRRSLSRCGGGDRRSLHHWGSLHDGNGGG